MYVCILCTWVELKAFEDYIFLWVEIPFSQDYDLPSYTTHVVCINFIREWWDLQFNVDSEQQSFSQKSAERKSPKKYVFFIFRFDG